MMSSIMQYFNGGIKVRRLLLGLKSALVAAVDGLQADATQSGDTVGIFTTVAGGAYSGKMPPWQNGRLALVWNQGANAMQLFSFESVAPAPYANVTQFAGSTGSLVAGTTGISVASGAFYLFVGSLDPTGAYPVWNEAAFGTSAGVFNGTVGATTPNTGAFTTLSTSGLATLASAAITGALKKSITTAITASTTQTLGQGQLTTDINVVTVVANSGDTVTLPTAMAIGDEVLVVNEGAHPLSIFPPTSGAAIDGGSAGAHATLTNASGGKSVRFIMTATNTIISTGIGGVSA